MLQLGQLEGAATEVELVTLAVFVDETWVERIEDKPSFFLGRHKFGIRQNLQVMGRILQLDP